jgi:hypothetical protein
MIEDGRLRRSVESHVALLGALERLKRRSSNPKEDCNSIDFSKAAIAKDAGVSVATLYRHEDIVEQINAMKVNREPRTVSRGTLRQEKLEGAILELERREAALIQENLRLQRELAKYDPTLGIRTPTSLDAIRHTARPPAVRTRARR